MTKAKLSPLPPNAVLNGYTIVRQVLEGGFSLVYLARDPQNQQVAIKEYLPSSLASRSEGQLAPQVLPRLRMYKRDSQLDPWTDMYAIGACIYSMMLGYPPPEVVKRRDKDPVPELLMQQRHQLLGQVD